MSYFDYNKPGTWSKAGSRGVSGLGLASLAESSQPISAKDRGSLDPGLVSLWPK